MQFLFPGPRGNDFLDFFGPFNLSAAAVAELLLQENFPFTILTEETLLLLKLLSQCDTLGPRSRDGLS